MSSCGLLVKMHARPGKDVAVEMLLRDALEMVRDEPDTVAWFAMRLGRGEFGIFEVFADDAARQEHLAGDMVTLLMHRSDELLKIPPRVQKLDVLAEKLPVVSSRPDTKGLLLMFKPKPGHEREVEDFLHFAQTEVNNERSTTAWFAIRTADGEYGIFDSFPANEDRLMHLFGHVPRELARQAFTLLGSLPDLSMVNIQAEKIGSDVHATLRLA
jgi:quinol monooxygenase YgiN